MFRKSLILLSMLMLAATLMYAQRPKPDEKPDEKKAAKITGFVVDVMCAKGIDAKDKEHTVSCSLMPKCAESGFAVVAKDNLYKLDENGNKLALAILKETKTKKGLAVAVVGTVKEGVLYVDTMSEVQ
jgi:S-layer protein (TIGR01564 family)